MIESPSLGILVIIYDDVSYTLIIYRAIHLFVVITSFCRGSF